MMMRLRSTLACSFLLVAKTGCSGSGGDPDMGNLPPNWVAPDCSSGPGTGTTLTYEVTGLALPDFEELPVAGFDLDGVDDQCTIADFDGSVDNGIAYLSPYLDILAAAAGDSSVAAVIANAIATDQLVIVLTMSGYDGSGNDPCVLVSLDAGPYGQDVVDAEAAVQANIVYAAVGDFGFSLPTTADVSADMDIHGGIATFDLLTGEGVVGGITNLGSDASYTEAEGMNAPIGTVYHAIYTIVDSIALLPPGISGVIDGALSRASDIGPRPSGTPCRGMTIGVEFEAAPVP